MESTSFVHLYNIDILVVAATVLYHGGENLGVVFKQNKIKVKLKDILFKFVRSRVPEKLLAHY
jgi:hypothetical protein